jgi:hypothetical protein
MTPLLRLALCAVAVSGLLAGAAALDPPTAAAFGVDVWSLPDRERQVREGEQRTAELDRYGKAVQGRLQEKARVAGELLEGLRTVRQAAARCSELNPREPAVTEQLRFRDPGRSEEESSCRQVLGFAEALVRPDRPDAQAALDRLRAEFAEWLREPGER